jgi:hypothetical protein
VLYFEFRKELMHLCCASWFRDEVAYIYYFGYFVLISCNHLRILLQVSIQWHLSIYMIFSKYCLIKYNESCVNRTSLAPALLFGINRCSVYTGQINNDFLHMDVTKSQVYTEIPFCMNLDFAFFVHLN